MVITEEQRAVMAHVVVDPDAWIDHAVATFGEAMAAVFLENKVARHRAYYEEKSAAPGYKTRAERDAE